jgi:hypothetical protein
VIAAIVYLYIIAIVFGVKANMEKRQYLLTMLFIVCLFNGACSSEPGIDKGKYKKIDATAQGVKASIDAGASYQQVADRIQELSIKIAELKDQTTTRREKDLVQAYIDLLTIYRDGLLLWRYKLEFPFFDSRLKGRIYIGQDVERIVVKYRFTTQSHIYAPTGQYWKSIGEDSIQKIWEDADFQLKAIHNITNY